MAEYVFELHPAMRDEEPPSELIGLMANRINWLAKTVGYEFYDLKPVVLRLLEQYPESAWTADDIVYVETPVGQVSFHQPPASTTEVLDVKGLVPGEWSGIPTQEFSAEILEEYLDKISWRSYEHLLV
jgi:hypothetical protein